MSEEGCKWPFSFCPLSFADEAHTCNMEEGSLNLSGDSKYIMNEANLLGTVSGQENQKGNKEIRLSKG